MVERMKGNKKVREARSGFARRDEFINYVKLKGFLCAVTCCRIALTFYSLQEGNFMMQKIEYLENGRTWLDWVYKNNYGSLNLICVQTLLPLLILN